MSGFGLGTFSTLRQAPPTLVDRQSDRATRFSRGTSVPLRALRAIFHANIHHLHANARKTRLKMQISLYGVQVLMLRHLPSVFQYY